MFHLRLPQLLLGLAAVAIIATAITYSVDRLGSKSTSNTNAAVYCAADVRLCPDGVTSVGRVPPSCEFAACPLTTNDWVEYRNSQLGISFRNPSDWTVGVDQLSFPGSDIVIKNQEAVNRCGCAMFITREENLKEFSIDDWLRSEDRKKMQYVLRENVEELQNTNSPFAGAYEETEITLNGIPAKYVRYGNEGGGYDRWFIPIADHIFVVTRWSDSYYFSDEARMMSMDGGNLNTVTNAILDTLTFF